MWKPGAFSFTNVTMLRTSSGLRSSMQIHVSSNQPFAFMCAAKSTRKSPQYSLNASVPGTAFTEWDAPDSSSHVTA